MRLLVHICCAPCLIYPHRRLKERGYSLTGFFYNPNIHPYSEYCRRREALVMYVGRESLEVIYRDEYPLEEFLAGVLGVGDRCEYCYAVRLESAAVLGVEEGFDAFTTTLLLSPYQRHDLIRDLGERMARKHGIPFYYEDFRVGFRESRRLSFDLGLYRQKYCGCIFSEYERYKK